MITKARPGRGIRGMLWDSAQGKEDPESAMLEAWLKLFVHEAAEQLANQMHPGTILKKLTWHRSSEGEIPRIKGDLKEMATLLAVRCGDRKEGRELRYLAELVQLLSPSELIAIAEDCDDQQQLVSQEGVHDAKPRASFDPSKLEQLPPEQAAELIKFAIEREKQEDAPQAWQQADIKVVSHGQRAFVCWHDGTQQHGTTASLRQLIQQLMGMGVGRELKLEQGRIYARIDDRPLLLMMEGGRRWTTDWRAAEKDPLVTPLSAVKPDEDGIVRLVSNGSIAQLTGEQLRKLKELEEAWLEEQDLLKPEADRLKKIAEAAEELAWQARKKLNERRYETAQAAQKIIEEREE